jgi:hypothetical protein
LDARVARFVEALDLSIFDENFPRLFEESVLWIFEARGDPNGIVEICPLFQIVEKILVKAAERRVKWWRFTEDATRTWLFVDNVEFKNEVLGEKILL